MKKNYLKLTVAVILFIVSSSVGIAWGEEKFCTKDIVESGICVQGDIAVLPQHQALLYCDFGKQVITYPDMGLNYFLCYYSGEKREKRS
jgi:hypothetical protein